MEDTTAQKGSATKIAWAKEPVLLASAGAMLDLVGLHVKKSYARMHVPIEENVTIRKGFANVRNLSREMIAQ